LRNDGKSRPAALKIEGGVCPISLGKESLIRLDFDDSSTEASMCKKGSGRECGRILVNHQHETSFEAFQMRDIGCGR
jgi:hypothetical protein